MADKKKCALITGSAKRLGKEIALYLANNDYDILLHCNNSYNDALEVKKSIENLGSSCKIYQYDFSNISNLENWIKNISIENSNLCVLINNASIFEAKSIEDSNIEYFDNNMKINFQAPYFLSKYFRKYCKTGSIINILDSRIEKNYSDYSVYTLSKKALGEFTKMASIEFAPKIRVNAVVPGFILPPTGAKDSFYKKRAKQIPLEKNGTIEDINKAIIYLLNNDYITGQFIYIDGGEHL